jgi:hypothetical protein
MSIWGALMGVGDYDIANLFFMASAILFLLQWGRATSISRPQRRVALFLSGMVVTIMVVVFVFRWTSHKSTEAETQKRQLAKLDQIPGLESQISTLRTTQNQSETARQVDNAYLRAKLEDAYKLNDQMRAFAPAVMQVAKAGQEFSRKQYEQKVLDNAQLKAFTASLVKRMRDLESHYKSLADEHFDAMRRKQMNRALARPPSAPKLTPEEIRTQGFIDAQEEQSFYTQSRASYEQSFHATMMADAQYARRELLLRVGGDDFLTVREKARADTLIDGMLAGPSPLADACDYLEALLKKLSP